MSETTTAPVDAGPAPIEVTVEVAVEPAAAFELFTSRLDQWWPVATHSVGGLPRVVSVRAEPGPEGAMVGGTVTEHWDDGGSSVWGTILDWDPPAGFTMTWHPGSDPATATEVSVSFTAVGPRRSQVRLVHRRWERLGERAIARRDGYATGWVTVLGELVDHASR